MRIVADVAPVLRGALARPSGSEDDPFLRVILRPAAAGGPGAQLDLRQAEPAAPVETLRDQVRQALARQAGAVPAFAFLPGNTILAVHGDPASEAEPLRNKIALVTGAAGAIGAGICRGLLEKGCRVAATDVACGPLEELVAEMKPSAAGRIMGVPMDVTDAQSAAAAFDEVACAWGGADIVVANAGLALAAPLMDMDLDAFRRLAKVNVEGTLLTLAEAGRRLCRQGTGGDIIVISTKNVFAPGAQFGAYSATKAGAHQLARIASLELAPHGIRVNMVAPDAVFSDGKRKSGLWAEVGPSRMKARGLDENGLEEYYRSRNLLKARVTATHVANAVLFFATRQTPTTGATIPVDGGLPDATPR